MSIRIYPSSASSTISKSQTESDSAVISDIPTPKRMPIVRSEEGTSSSPKKNSHPARFTVANPRDCPDTSSTIASSTTECTTHSNSIMPFFCSVMNLMRALDSDQPLTTDATSSNDAEITALSFLLESTTSEAKRLHPFFRDTLLRAKQR